MALVKKCAHARGLTGDARDRAWLACRCQWVADLRTGGGRVYISLGPNLREASARYNDLRRQAAGGVLIRSGQAATFNNVCDAWLATKRHGLRPQSHARYEGHMAHARRWFGDRPVAGITTRHIDTFSQGLLDADLAVGTVRTIRNLTMACLRHAHRLGLTDAPPEATRLDARETDRQPVQVLDIAVAEAAIAQADEPERWLLQLTLWTGLRPSEALALETGDVLGRVLRVERTLVQATGKTGPPKTKAGRRSIDLVPQAVEALRHANTSGRLFATNYGRLERRWHTACRRAGIAQQNLKVLRHTNASMRLASGQSLAYIASQMGHSNPSMTLSVYSHLMPGLPSEVDRLAVITQHGAP